MGVKIIKEQNVFIDPTVKLIGEGTLTIGSGCEIRAYSVIEFGDNGKLTIAKNTVIGYHNFLQVTGEINIGKGTYIGPGCVFLASSHPINNKLLSQQPLIKGKVDIGSNIWFGANCTIGYNTTIGDNAIIGANSFVNKNIPADKIYGGTPAKYLKDR